MNTPHVRNCPYCDHTGAFDGRGREATKEYEVIKRDGTETYKELHYRHGCTACGEEFVSIQQLEP